MTKVLPVMDSVGYTLVGFGDDDPFEYQAQLSSKFLFALSSGQKCFLFQKRAESEFGQHESADSDVGGSVTNIDDSNQ